MSIPAPSAPESSRNRGTSERRVASLFGLKGDSWMRHANPWSVWTRFAVVLVFLVVNPMLFHEPGSTRNWASKSVFGEHIWSDRDTVELPGQLDVLSVVAGLVIAQTAKAWYLDRMVLLYEDMKARSLEYAAWER
jgi:hypothetical protein